MTEQDVPIIPFERYLKAVQETDPLVSEGNVTQVIGPVLEADGPSSRLGELCLVYCGNDETPAMAEVVGFKDEKILLMAIEDITGIRPGSRVVASGRVQSTLVGPELLGRVVDGLGRPIDGKGPIHLSRRYPLEAAPPNPLTRSRINQVLPFGVKAIDGLLTCGKGQRIGVFSGSGVGKSTLMGMISRNSSAQVNVIALIGERGREVRDFIERDLGEEGLARSVVVAATSDQPPLMRIKGAYTATAIAEYFRDQGQDVMLMMDSVTRFAMAQREIGLAIGEPPATKGYTPSVYAMLPKLMERAGTSDKGTITALYTVLVEGDDTNEPIADITRGILDGHIVLSRDLAMQNHYPAIDVLASVSRLMTEITDARQQEAASLFKELLATYRKAEDLINIGAYVSGSNAQIDYAIAIQDRMTYFLRQSVDESVSFDETKEILYHLF